MNLIIAGSRELDLKLSDIDTFVAIFDLAPKEVVSGGASGVDYIGGSWANVYNVPVKLMLADWGQHGKAAGPIRNKAMAEYGDALLLIWDGKSKGSASMLKEMKKLKKPIYEVILREHK